MAILLKWCKPDNFVPQHTQKFGFTNIWGFRSNFNEFESFLESNSPDILVLCEANLDDSNEFGNFYVKGCLPLIPKDPTIPL